MAIVIKSNQYVNDPDNIFPYVSEYGPTTQSLGYYSLQRSIAQAPVSQAEHLALKALEDGLTNINVFSKLLEFIPFMGSNLASMLLKYKYVDNDRMSVLNGFSAANIEPALGLTFPVPLANNSPCLNMKLKQKRLASKGYTAFYYYYSPVNASVTLERTFWGVGNNDASDTSTTQLQVDGARRIDMKFLNANAIFSDKFYFGKFALASKMAVSGGVTERKLFDNGVKVGDITGTVAVNDSSAYEKDLYLGAKNGSTVGGTKFFYGSLRYMMVFDGTITDVEVGLIQSLLNTFVTSTGKTL